MSFTTRTASRCSVSGRLILAPGLALVSVNPAIVTHHPDLALSTLAHEVGHVVFDVPAALGQQARRYR